MTIDGMTDYEYSLILAEETGYAKGQEDALLASGGYLSRRSPVPKRFRDGSVAEYTFRDAYDEGFAEFGTGGE